MDIQRRSAQVQLVREARGEEVLLIAEAGIHHAHGLQQIGALPDEVRKISVVAGAGENADQPRKSGRVAPRVFQRRPGGFQKDALLRVHHLGLTGRDAEKSAIEILRLLDHPARRHKPGQRAHEGRIVAGGPQFLIGEAREAIFPRRQTAPEIGRIRRAGKTARQSDDRDSFGWN